MSVVEKKVERIYVSSRFVPGVRSFRITLQNPVGIIIERGVVVQGIDLTEVQKFISIHNDPSYRNMMIFELDIPFPKYMIDPETQILKLHYGF